jgi:hypothetical protein
MPLDPIAREIARVTSWRDCIIIGCRLEDGHAGPHDVVLSCGCCRGPESDRCVCHNHQDVPRGRRTAKCSRHAPTVPNHETHQDIESADFARLNPAASLLQGLDGRAYRDIVPSYVETGRSIKVDVADTRHKRDEDIAPRGWDVIGGGAALGDPEPEPATGRFILEVNKYAHKWSGATREIGRFETRERADKHADVARACNLYRFVNVRELPEPSQAVHVPVTSSVYSRAEIVNGTGWPKDARFQLVREMTESQFVPSSDAAQLEPEPTRIDMDHATTLLVGEVVECYPDDVNPGPWHDLDGIYFEVGGTTFGPYPDEDAAEDAFDRELRKAPTT